MNAQFVSAAFRVYRVTLKNALPVSVVISFILKYLSDHIKVTAVAVSTAMPQDLAESVEVKISSFAS
jgi:hypothetical protein